MGQYKHMQVEQGLLDQQCLASVRPSFSFHSHLVVPREIKIKLEVKKKNIEKFFFVLCENCSVIELERECEQFAHILNKIERKITF